MSEAERVPTGVDPSRLSAARVYDYILGGTNNFEIDRAGADQLRAAFPELENWAWTNRGFHQRAARWLAGERGIRQFLDIGSGLPTQMNTHEVVQAIVPDATVLYVDNDPSVAVHAEVLLAGSGRVRFVAGDLRDPDTLLNHPDIRSAIDFRQPVGLFLTAILHFVSDESKPHDLVATYVDALAPGSYLALSHGTADRWPPEVLARGRAVYQNASAQLHARSRDEVARFFEGLELVPPYDGAEPAVTYGGMWGAEDPEAADDDASRALYCGVARRP